MDVWVIFNFFYFRYCCHEYSNTCLLINIMYTVLLGISLKMYLLGHSWCSLSAWVVNCQFSKVDVQIYSPIGMGDFLFLHILISTLYSPSFLSRPFWGVDTGIPLSFKFAFTWVLTNWGDFSYGYHPFTYPPLWVFSPFCYWAVFFLLILYIFWICGFFIIYIRYVYINTYI